MKLPSTIIILLILTITSAEYTNTGSHTDIVLLGATGDLAKKYLWQGFFNLFVKERANGYSFTFYGCGRRHDDDDGLRVLHGILRSSVTCPENDAVCKQSKEEFIERTYFKQLKKEIDYKILGEILEHSENKEWTLYSRFFYLSIPPFSYVSTAKNINSYCRPKTDNASLRVILEKPFGHGEKSAHELADEISHYFTDKEIYRIDHYIGKSVVQEILPFRALESVKNIWNRHHISRVDIVMKEVADVKDRIAYYEEYGVIRDVIQNHLMELLVLVAMEIPDDIHNSKAIQQNKLSVLDQITPLTEEATLLGQYRAYLDEVKNQNASVQSTNTPTFAAIVARINNQRWKDVPFFLMSGKKLETRHSYIKVYFKDNDFSFDSVSRGCKQSKEIVFNIGNGYPGAPVILVSKTLAESLLLHDIFDQNDVTEDGHVMLHPTQSLDAYSTLIQSLYHGQIDQFISTDHLFKSWKIWSPLVTALEPSVPVVYRGGKHSNLDLKFKFDGHNLEFITAHKHEKRHGEMLPLLSIYRGYILKVLPIQSGVGSQCLIDVLENDIGHIAHNSVEQRGVFHIALSGGSTPVKLFRKLTHSVKPFPWKQTHIWLVDERCVPFNHSESNFKSIWDNLLSYVDIPHWHIHRMPVECESGICIPWEDRFYATQIRHFIPDSMFDFMLLGVGRDGHTASIFPGETNRAFEQDNLVFYSKATSTKRMSLSYEMINRSRNIGVLVTGKDKHDILQTIKKEDDIDNLPILGVTPDSGNLTWYVDTQAWQGL